MPYYITKAQFDDLTKALEKPNAEKPFADMYDLVYGYLGSPDLFGTDAPGATYAWFGAAAQTNRGEGGGASDFIRDYTQAQIEIRVGYTQADIGDILQEASDRIAGAVYRDIVLGETELPDGTILYEIPTAVDIGIEDAVATVEVLNERTNVQNGIGTWSGNPLYIGLGSSMFWNDNVLAGAEDAYEFTVAMEALSYAASTINGLDGFTDLVKLFSEQGDEAIYTLPAATSAGAATAAYLATVYGLIDGITAGISKLNNNFIPFDPGGFAAGREGDFVDTLYSSASSDFVHAGDGNDTIFGSLGEDLIDGGSGVDIADFSAVNVSYIVTLPESLQTGTADFSGYVAPLLGTTGTTTLYNIETLRLGASDDVVIFDFGMNLQEIDLGGEGETGDAVDFSTISEQGITASSVSGIATVGLKGTPAETVEIKDVEILIGSGQGDDFDISGNGVFYGAGGADKFFVSSYAQPIIVGGSGADEIVINITQDRDVGLVVLDMPDVSAEDLNELSFDDVLAQHPGLDLSKIDAVLVNPDFGVDKIFVQDANGRRPLKIETVTDEIGYVGEYEIEYEGVDQTFEVQRVATDGPPTEEHDIFGAVSTWDVRPGSAFGEDFQGAVFGVVDSLESFVVGESRAVAYVYRNGINGPVEIYPDETGIRLGESPDYRVIPDWVGDLGIGGAGVEQGPRETGPSDEELFPGVVFNDPPDLTYWDYEYDLSSAAFREEFDDDEDQFRANWWWEVEDSVPHIVGTPNWFLIGAEVDREGQIVGVGTQAASQGTVVGTFEIDALVASHHGQALSGLAGNDFLMGGDAADELDGGTGDDALTGGDAGDRFLFSWGDGDDTVTDFSIVEDTIVIDGLAIVPHSLPSDVTATARGGDVVLSYGDGDTITLIGADFADWTPNTAPVAENDTATIGEDSSGLFDVLANDTDADGNALTLTSAVGAINGSVAIEDGHLRYTPDADYAGSEIITYEVSDGRGGTAVGTFTVTIDPVNDAPVVVDEARTVAEDAIVDVDVLANDTDIDSTNLSITSVDGQAIAPGGRVTLASGMTVELLADGSLRLDQDGAYDLLRTGYEASEAISYIVSDGDGGSATGLLSVVIEGNTDTLIGSAGADTMSGTDFADTIESLAGDDQIDGRSGDDDIRAGTGDDMLTGGAGGDLFRFSSGDGADIVMDFVIGEDAIEVDGVVLVPEALPAGVDASQDGADVIVAYGSGDAIRLTDADVRDWVPNTAPAADADTASLQEDGTILIDVLANDTDPDGDDLIVATIGGAANGTVVLEDGQFRYTPNADFFGTEEISYTVSDGEGGTATAVVTITVEAVNDAPIVNGEMATVAEDSILEIDVLANDTDVDDTTLMISSVGGQAISTGGRITLASGFVVELLGSGSLRIDQAGAFEALRTDQTALEEIAYVVSDGSGGLSNGLLSLTIAGETDPILGTDGDDLLAGTIWDDVIIGGAGNDTVDGGAGDDTITGGAGDDLLVGGTGSDSLDGGAGSDTVSYEDATQGVFITLYGDDQASTSSGAAGDIITSVENIVGSASFDYLWGDANANTFSGHGGNDQLRGGGGNDALQGGEGNDFLWGHDGDDRLDGGAGNDRVTGGGGTIRPIWVMEMTSMKMAVSMMVQRSILSFGSPMT